VQFDDVRTLEKFYRQWDEKGTDALMYVRTGATGITTFLFSAII